MAPNPFSAEVAGAFAWYASSKSIPDSIKRELEPFIAYASVVCPLTDDISLWELNDWLDSLPGHPNKHAGAKHEGQRFLRWLADEGLTPENPFELRPRHTTEFAPTEQWQAFLVAAIHPRQAMPDAPRQQHYLPLLLPVLLRSPLPLRKVLQWFPGITAGLEERVARYQSVRSTHAPDEPLLVTNEGLPVTPELVVKHCTLLADSLGLDITFSEHTFRDRHIIEQILLHPRNRRDFEPRLSTNEITVYRQAAKRVRSQPWYREDDYSLAGKLRRWR